MPTPQEKMQAKLKQVGLPYKQIEVYGRQIVITTHSRSAAEKWALTLSPKVAKLRGITENYDRAKKNKNTVMLPTRVKVYRAFFKM